MSGYIAPKEPPPGFQLTDVTQQAAGVLLEMLEEDHDEVPDWVRKAAAGVDPTSVPSNGHGDPGEPPGGASGPTQRHESSSTVTEIPTTGGPSEDPVIDLRPAPVRHRETQLGDDQVLSAAQHLVFFTSQVEPELQPRLLDWAERDRNIHDLPIDMRQLNAAFGYDRSHLLVQLLEAMADNNRLTAQLADIVASVLREGPQKAEEFAARASWSSIFVSGSVQGSSVRGLSERRR